MFSSVIKVVFVGILAMSSLVSYSQTVDPFYLERVRLDKEIAATGKKILALQFQGQMALDQLQRKPSRFTRERVTSFARMVESEEVNLISMMIRCNEIAYRNAERNFAKLGITEKKAIVFKQVVEAVMNWEICSKGDPCICGVDLNDHLDDDPFGDFIIDTLATWGASFGIKVVVGTVDALRVFWAVRSEVSASFLVYLKTGIAAFGSERGSISLAEGAQEILIGKHSGVLGQGGIIGSFDPLFPLHAGKEGSHLARLEEAIITYGVKGKELPATLAEVAPAFIEPSASKFISITDLREIEAAKRVIQVKKAIIAKKYNGSPFLFAEASLGFRTHRMAVDALSSVLAPVGRSRAVHHFVEKQIVEKARLAPRALQRWVQSHLINNEANYVKLPKKIHDSISTYYSCGKFKFAGYVPVREWLRNRCKSNYDCYYYFGLEVVEDALNGVLKACR